MNEVIAKPPGNIARQCAIPEKCGSDVRVSGKAGGFAISSNKIAVTLFIALYP